MSSTPAHSKAESPTPFSSKKIIKIAFVLVACAAFYGLALLFLWRPIIGAVHHGFSPSNIIKGWYLGDQLSYLSITSNVSAGIPAYEEPIMLDGSSIYPSGYYWFLGIIGRVTGLNPFALWNIVGFIMTCALMLVAGYWGKRMTKNAWGWVVGPLPILVGTLEWWSTKGWMHQYGGVQAVEWPGYAILFNPGTEQFSLTLASIVLLLTVLGIRADGTISIKHIAVAGLITGLMLNTHSYIPLLTLTTVSAIFVLCQGLIHGSTRRWLLIAACFFGGIGIAALHIPSIPLGRFVMVVAGLVVPMLLVSTWRRNMFKALVYYFGFLIVASLPLMLRIAAMARTKDSFFYFRQHLYDGMDFSIPMRWVFQQGAPVLVLGVLAAVFLWRKRNEDERTPIWIAAIVSVAVITLLMEWNAHWGFGQEPYRFFPYQMILLTVVAAPWLVSKFKGRADLIGRGLAVVLLLATAPTTWQFYKATRPSLLHISAGEQTTFKQIAAQLPENGAVLTDVCIPRKVFKVTTHAAVADIVIGLALPNHYEALGPVLNAQRSGSLASNEDLRNAGITSFLAMNYCKSASESELTERFGAPIGEYRLPDPTYCGLPADAKYDLYKVPQTNAPATSYQPLDLKDPFGTAYKSTPETPLPPTQTLCALSTY